MTEATVMPGTGLRIPRTEDAKWRTLYDAIREAEYGRTYTYSELSRLAGLEPDEDIRDDRWIVHRCRVELLRHDHRYLDNVRSVGYRVVRAEEHLRAGNDYRKKSMRAAGRSQQVLGATDLGKIEDPAVRAKIVEMETRMGWMQQALRHHDTRLDDTEQVTERLTLEQADYSDRLAAVEERIRRMSGMTDEDTEPSG